MVKPCSNKPEVKRPVQLVVTRGEVEGILKCMGIEKDMTVSVDENEVLDRRVLKRVLAINTIQIVASGTVGIVAESTGLLGAALDNLGDASVYAVSLYTVGRSASLKARAAKLSGVLLVGLGVSLLIEVIRRFSTGSDPLALP